MRQINVSIVRIPISINKSSRRERERETNKSYRRLKSSPLRPSPGQTKTAAPTQIELLRDSDQPFIYDIRFSRKTFTLEAYDTACPDQHWSTLRPDMVVLTFDISNRGTLAGLRAVSKQPLSPDDWIWVFCLTFDSGGMTLHDTSSMDMAKRFPFLCWV